MSRTFCGVGIVVLALALACAILASLSLPFLSKLEVVRTHFSGNILPQANNQTISEIRLGIWSFCTYAAGSNDRTCSARNAAYSALVNGQGNSITVNKGWTRGLVITPVAGAVTLVAFLLSFSEHLLVTLVASLVSFLAALLMLIAFICDIALFVLTQKKMNDLDGVEASSHPGAGFWLTFASFLLLLIAGFTVCCGRRRDQRRGAGSYPVKSSGGGFLSRFRRRRV